MWSPRMKSMVLLSQRVGESALHRSMKAIVRSELERGRYAVVEEPLYPPGDKASWRSYRPDLLGYRSEGGARSWS